MKREQRERRKLIAKFRRQENVPLLVRIILAAGFDKMLQAVNDGDQQAEYCANAVKGWFDFRDNLLNNGQYPICSCDRRLLDDDDVGGWITVSPSDLKTDSTGMISALCQNCIKHDRNQLAKQFTKQVEEDTDTEIVPIQ